RRGPTVQDRPGPSPAPFPRPVPLADRCGAPRAGRLQTPSGPPSLVTRGPDTRSHVPQITGGARGGSVTGGVADHETFGRVDPGVVPARAGAADRVEGDAGDDHPG